MKAIISIVTILWSGAVSAQNTAPVTNIGSPGSGTISPMPQLVDALKVIGDGSRPVFVASTIGPTRGYTPGGASVGIVPLPSFFGPRQYAANGRFLNLSVRALVGPGDQSIVAGITIGDGGRVVLIRAVGPSLASFGVSGVVLRPQLQIFDSSGTVVARAVPWSSNDPAIIAELRKVSEDVGAFALRESSDDQVLLLVLGAGAFTCVVTGAGGSTGVVLLEAYELPR